MSKLCQNWQKWQWPIWCISSRWRKEDKLFSHFKNIFCFAISLERIYFLLRPNKYENKAILKHDQHVARRIGHKWVATCYTLPSLDPKKGWQRYHLTSTYGIPAWRWEVPPNNFGRIPCASPSKPLLLSPQRRRPHCSPWTAGEPFGEVLGHWPLPFFLA